MLSPFHRFQHSQKGGRYQVSDLMRAQPLKLLNGRETVARCYMPIKCQAWRVRPLAFAANLQCIWAPNLETGCHGLTVTCGCMWLPYHVMTRAHGSTFLTTPSFSPTSLWNPESSPKTLHTEGPDSRPWENTGVIWHDQGCLEVLEFWYGEFEN